MKTKTRSAEAPIDLKKLKRLPRGTFLAKPGDTDTRNTKVRISILVDLDVLNFFKQRAEKPGALAYQTQINQTLRSAMETTQPLDAKSLAQDDEFIRAVAKRVQQLSTKRTKSA